MKKIRVLHIITRLDPGGSTTNTLETVARLNKDIYEVDLIAGKTEDPLGAASRFIQENGLRVTFLSDLVRNVHLWHDHKAFWALVGLIKKGKYDIVHTHSSKAGLLGRFAARLAGVKYVVHTPHGHVFHGYFSPLTTGTFIWLERIAAGLTDKLIALTDQGVKDHLHYHVGRPEQWSAIYSGIDLGKFKEVRAKRSVYRAELGLKEDDFVFVCVGRLDPVKGQAVLIEAMASVAEVGPSARLFLVGDGSERERLTARVGTLGLEGQVFFFGFQEDLERFLGAADVFVLASLNEGMGRAVLEAMAAGLPLIVSRTGGLPEIVEDGREGFLITPGDHEGFAIAMRTLMSDKDLCAKLAMKAKTRATGKFSVESMVEQIERLYARLGEKK